MTTKAKLITGALSLSTLGGGFALTNYLATPEKPLGKTVSEILKEHGFDVNVKDWTPILTAYNALKDKTKTFKTTDDDPEITKEVLMQKCAEALSKLEINIDNYRKARQWCVVEETADKILKNANYNVFDSSKDDATDAGGKWEAKTKQLKEFPSGYPNVGITMSGDKAKDIPALKKACAGLKINELKTTDKDFNQNFELAKSWCSEKQNNQE